MTTTATFDFVSKKWDEEIVPTLSEYIRIPNVSPLFDKEWKTNGFLHRATELLANWAREQPLQKFSLEVIQVEDRTPIIFIEIPATREDYNGGSILMYGHLDKQPPLTNWKEGLSPYTPVIRDGKLYGRGGADDGYAIFAAVTSVLALESQNIDHGKIVILIEASEESGSPDLPFYIQLLNDQERIKNLDLIICLDSGCGNYEQLWLTSSLRGLLVGNLKVEILKEGAHSGHASGIVPSSFRIARLLLNRLENPETGEIIPRDFYVDLTDETINQAKACANTLGKHIYEEFTFVGQSGPISQDIPELLLNRTWRPQLEVTGVEGIPSLEKAGNVLRSYTTLKLSIRLPPTKEAQPLKEIVKNLFESNPPYGAQVTFEFEKASTGWACPVLHPWLRESVTRNTQYFFEKDPNFLGEGGSIPFMGMLGKMYPQAQFVVTGLLGPESNAHGPNEMLHIDMGKKLTATVAGIIADHFSQKKEK